MGRLKAEKGEHDHHWYEPTWYVELQRLTRAIESGERNLSRVLDLAVANRGNKNFFTERARRIWLGKMRAGPASLVFPERRAMRNALLHEACTPETDSIIDLGSGPGYHLFWFWLAGGPRDARYMAFEITKVGRLCTELLAKLGPGIRASAHAFDYYAPDYSPVPGGQRHIVVYTNGSIEQIGQLPEAALWDLTTKAKRVTFLHWEPVGWQIEDNPQHKERCLKLGYNENLWPMLKKWEAEKRIVIDRTFPNIFGKDHHMAAFIQWRKR